MHDLGQQLDANGLSDLRFSGPELAKTSTSWLAAMMADPYLMSKMDHFGLHGYQGLSYDSTGVYDFIQQSAYPNTHFWMTEFGVWCRVAAGGRSGDGSWTYAQGTASVLIDHLANGASAGVVYAATTVSTLATIPRPARVAGRCLELLGIVRGGQQQRRYQHLYAAQAVLHPFPDSRYVRPGAQRINVNGSTTPLTLLAFYHSTIGQLTLTGVNTAASPASLSGTLASLPRSPAWNCITPTAPPTSVTAALCPSPIATLLRLCRPTASSPWLALLRQPVRP